MRSQRMKALLYRLAIVYCCLDRRDLQSSASDTANLHHGRDVGLDVGVFLIGDLVGGMDTQFVPEMLRAESAADETFVDTSGSSHQTEGEDGEP